MRKWSFQKILIIFLLILFSCSGERSFRFTLTGDPRSGISRWQHTLNQIKKHVGGVGAFHITAGDYFEEDYSTVAADFYHTLAETFGNNIKWYPTVGNHELNEGGVDIKWLQKYYRDHLKGKVNPGPQECEETTYSWDYGIAHFVQLDQYCAFNDSSENVDGSFDDILYDWLVADLNENTKPVVFVIYHEPAFPEGRGGKDNPPAGWQRFLKLLNEQKVVATLCAHTHTYARYQPEGDWESFTWEVDAGNAGRMSHADNHQTFVDITVNKTGKVKFDTWQGEYAQEFRKMDSWTVNVPINRKVNR